MNIYPVGISHLNGGTYQSQKEGIIFHFISRQKKILRVRPGGRIYLVWRSLSGSDESDGSLTQKDVSIQPLLAISTLANTESKLYSKDILWMVSWISIGNLLSPDITFGFDFSDFPLRAEMCQTYNLAFSKPGIAQRWKERTGQVFLCESWTRGFSTLKAKFPVYLPFLPAIGNCSLLSWITSWVKIDKT